jgi:hypothetical protein
MKNEAPVFRIQGIRRTAHERPEPVKEAACSVKKHLSIVLTYLTHRITIGKGFTTKKSTPQE